MPCPWRQIFSIRHVDLDFDNISERKTGDFQHRTVSIDGRVELPLYRTFALENAREKKQIFSLGIDPLTKKIIVVKVVIAPRST